MVIGLDYCKNDLGLTNEFLNACIRDYNHSLFVAMAVIGAFLVSVFTVLVSKVDSEEASCEAECWAASGTGASTESTTRSTLTGSTSTGQAGSAGVRCDARRTGPGRVCVEPVSD